MDGSCVTVSIRKARGCASLRMVWVPVLWGEAEPSKERPRATAKVDQAATFWGWGVASSDVVCGVDTAASTCVQLPAPAFQHLNARPNPPVPKNNSNAVILQRPSFLGGPRVRSIIPEDIDLKDDY